jgi:outer membrane protein insertion porin family
MPVSGGRDSSFVAPAAPGYGHPPTHTRMAQYEPLPPTPTNMPPSPSNGGGSATYGSDGFSPQRLPGVDPGFAPNGAFPANSLQMMDVDTPYGPTADFDVFVQETHTGRFMFGVGINSDAGLTGSVVIDERNFDIMRVPTSFDEFVNGTAWRGGGQGFRLEAMPGTQVQRYMISFTEPYLFGTDVSASISGYLYDRNYFDYDERRGGGRLGLGYRLTPDLSVSTSIRAEQVDITDPRSLVPPLVDVLGKSDLYSGRIALSHDTRDIPFSPTEGHFFEASYEHVFGDYEYPRFGLDYRKYFLMLERSDGSGRHVLAASFNFGISGEDTPMFENYYAGGYATLRGFRYRGASPKVGDVTVGGRLKFLGSVEYMIPITADDMLRFVAFCDYGTIERDIEIENFRVAPGVGLRIFIPAMGPAPIALDFAFPVAKADGDETEVFSFFIGFGR